jgi:hypothetical protein
LWSGSDRESSANTVHFAENIRLKYQGKSRNQAALMLAGNRLSNFQVTEALAVSMVKLA